MRNLLSMYSNIQRIHCGIMSSSTAAIQSPINVSAALQKMTCYEKCFLNVNYGISTCTATNGGDHLALSYDKDSSTSVQYNEVSYQVQDVRIYAPSLNQYNGQSYPAEVFIHHISTTGNNLLMCIPVKAGGASAAAKLFHGIIPYAPTDVNTATTINVADYTLNHWIPRGAYYSATGTLPYDSQVGGYQLLFFDDSHAISMGDDDLAILAKIITPAAVASVSSPAPSQVAYNKKGHAGSGSAEEDIYIDCQPVQDTGEDEPTPEEAAAASKATLQNTNTGLLTLGSIILGLIGLIGLVGLMLVLMSLFNGSGSGGWSGFGATSLLSSAAA
jgi:carbonic anhydrase